MDATSPALRDTSAADDGAPAQHRCEGATLLPLGPDDVETTIGERFRAVAHCHGRCLAVADGATRLTYAELEGWARSIAVELQDAGVEPGERVVLLLDQGAPAVAAVLGVLLAGAVYVPLDPGEPEARLASLLERVAPAAIEVDDTARGRVSGLGTGLPMLRSADAGLGDLWRLPAINPAAPAAIHFTSGSTGQPKGVLDRHGSIVHNAMRYTVGLRIEAADRLSLVQAPSSSATMSSLFAALLNGAAVFPYRLDAASLGTLADWLRDERVTIYHSVPSILRRALAFAGQLPDVRVVRLEGDRAYGQDMAAWRRHFLPGTRIANGLGTTETGLCRQLVVRVEEEVADGIMPVGYPVTGMEVEVVADDGSPLRAGATGEIAVTSRSLASGYWGDERLTASAFVAARGRPGLRTYRTGDLGRLRADGCLEYLGRRDGLSKVLGQRVEPAEVEAALATIPGVEAAVVRIEADERGEGRIAAWVVAPGLDEADLRAGAAARLPAHMRPSSYVAVPELPLSASGKVDRSALATPATATLSAVGGGRDLEGTVTSVVSEILRRSVGPDEDLFAAGLDSLAAVDLVLTLERAVGHPLPPSLVAGAPTVAQLGAAVREALRAPRSGLVPLAASHEGTPLVLVPGHYGHALMYAPLARRLDGVRPVLGLDIGSSADGSEPPVDFNSVARLHVAALRAARATGSLERPYLLGGFCFGGAMAYEVARRLIEIGDGPAGLFLFGVSPYDFPSLVPDGAEARWRRSVRPAGQIGRAVRLAAGLATSDGRAWLTGRLRHRGRAAAALLTPTGRERRRARRPRDAATHAVHGHYEGPALDLPVTIIVPGWSAAAYCEDPLALWTAMGPRAATHVLPGIERMMVNEPVVAKVAQLMGLDPGLEAPGGTTQRRSEVD